MGNAVAQRMEFDDAYRQVDCTPYRDLPAFNASNRGNAYRIYLEIEADTLAADAPASSTQPASNARDDSLRGHAP